MVIQKFQLFGKLFFLFRFIFRRRYINGIILELDLNSLVYYNVLDKLEEFMRVMDIWREVFVWEGWVESVRINCVYGRFIYVLDFQFLGVLFFFLERKFEDGSFLESRIVMQVEFGYREQQNQVRFRIFFYREERFEFFVFVFQGCRFVWRIFVILGEKC